MAAQESARTTGLHDHRGDEVSILKRSRELQSESFMAEPTNEELLERIAELERQAGQKKNAGALSFKVSDKGAVSVYGHGPLSGHCILRAVTQVVGRGRGAAGVPGRKQEPPEAEGRGVNSPLQDDQFIEVIE